MSNDQPTIESLQVSDRPSAFATSQLVDSAVDLQCLWAFKKHKGQARVSPPPALSPFSEALVAQLRYLAVGGIVQVVGVPAVVPDGLPPAEAEAWPGTPHTPFPSNYG